MLKAYACKKEIVLPWVYLKYPSQILFRRLHKYKDLHINIMYRKCLLYCRNFLCWYYMSGFQKRKSYVTLMLITHLCKVSDVLNKMYVFTDLSVHFHFLSLILLWVPKSWQLIVKRVPFNSLMTSLYIYIYLTLYIHTYTYTCIQLVMNKWTTLWGKCSR